MNNISHRPPNYTDELAMILGLGNLWKVEIISHFTLAEVACNCGCGLLLIQPRLLLIENAVRQEFGEPIYISSWCRCIWWNKHENGKKYSFHRFGKAVDQRPLHGPVTTRFIEICQKHFPFVKIYDTFLHCDIRGRRSLRP